MNSAACNSASIRSSLVSACEATCGTRPSGDSRPITARVCSRSFCSAESRSIRAASIPCTVEGRRNCARERATFTAPICCSLPLRPSPFEAVDFLDLAARASKKVEHWRARLCGKERKSTASLWERDTVRVAPHQRALVEQRLHHLLDEERV